MQKSIPPICQERAAIRCFRIHLGELGEGVGSGFGTEEKWAAFGRPFVVLSPRYLRMTDICEGTIKM